MTPGEPPPAAPDPWLGRTLGGTYRLDARLGAGAMGTVYRAHHVLLDQDFAVKVLAPGLADDADVRRRFLVEARSLAAFTHKHAVQVRHCGEDRGALYLAMDLVRGETLADLLAREGSLPAARAAGIAAQVLGALDEAHTAGIVHRDLKPGNVMVETTRGPGGDASDRVRVVDFGLARIVDAERAALPSAYASFGGTIVGTVAYMAPEQLRAEDDVDGRADQFAVGVVVYEMLTGAAPFPGTSTMSIALRVVAHPPTPWPPATLAAVPPALRDVVERALAKAPGDRFASAGAMAEAIRAALRGTAPPQTAAAATSGVSTAPGAASGRSRARGRRAAALALAALLAVAAGGWWVLRERPPPATADAARARGEVALAQGRFSAAVDAFGEVIAAAPKDGAAWLGRAEARTGLLDHNARADLDEAGRLRDGDVAVLVARARYFARVERDRGEADRAVVAALSLDPRAVDARVVRAETSLAANDLEQAELDVTALERDAPDEAWGPVLRARLLVARAGQPDVAAARRARLLADAVTAGRRAADLDPRWREGATALQSALHHQATAAKSQGAYDDARAGYAAAEAAATAAIERVQAAPAHRRQGATLVTALQERAGVRFLALDFAGAAADLEEAVRLAPRDPDLLSTLAYARQQTGEHERAIEVYARLYEITGAKDHVFRQGFGWQRLGDERAEVGDVEGARTAYDRALEVYARAVARFADADGLRAYRGETWVRRARLQRGPDRAADLARAKTELDDALALHPSDSETLLRRGEWALAADRPAEALADLTAAIGGRKDRTPRFYARWAQAALEDADRAPPGDVVTRAARRARATEAVEAVTRAIDLFPELAPFVLPLRASALVRVASLADDDAARDTALAAAEADLARVEQPARGATPTDEVRARATAAHGRAEVSLARGDAAGAVAAARAAVAARDAEHAARRWSLDARWLERLADALAAAGDAAGADAARLRAATAPR